MCTVHSRFVLVMGILTWNRTRWRWVQLPVTPTLAAPVHDEAALAEVAARVREAVG